jgi:uncharacterized membrane protein
VSTPEYLPEPPDDATPALAYGLANEGGDSSNTVLATLLDLIERGYYDTKQATTEKEKLDLSVTKASKRPTKDLEPYEKQVLDFFDELIGDESVAFSEMKDRIPEHDSSWRSKWNNMTSALDEADEGHLAWDRDLRKWRFLLFLVMLAAFAFVVFAYANVERLWFLPTAIGVVTLLVILASGGSKLKRLSPDYRERSSKWQAFAHWTDDFPRLKDDPPATLELWKKILIYGVAFGTAERMIASGRIPAPVLESTDNNSWTYYAMANPHIGDSALAGSSFSSGFSSQVAPESSGGGGGFSGGGGGGASGGGGGGSW